MVRSKNMVAFDVGKNKQITVYGYDWRNSILNWTLIGKPIYHISIELFRFKIEWHWYGSPF